MGAAKVKRILDVLLAIIMLTVLLPFIVLIAILVQVDSPGPVLYAQKRVGQGGRFFTIYKFRTMIVGTPELATDRLSDPQRYITRVGRFLRKTSLDELPQLWNILREDMSFVGPRPALHNQKELIALRRAMGIDRLKPGLTGWAQINGRDEVNDVEKAELDAYYLRHQSLWLDLLILLRTVLAVGSARGIAQ